MSIFERVGDLIKSNVNDLLDRAEDPEKMVKQMVVDMEKQFQKATQELGTATGGLNRLKKQLEEAKKQSENWNTKAKACLSQGDEELAKRALENKVMQDKLVTQYQGMYDSMEKQVEELKNQTMQLKQKLEEARSKKAVLVARSQVADSKMSAAKTLSGIDSSSAFAKMDKMEQKIMDKEAQAAVSADVFELQGETDAFATVEKKENVNAELDRLKKEMGL